MGRRKAMQLIKTPEPPHRMQDKRIKRTSKKKKREKKRSKKAKKVVKKNINRNEEARRIKARVTKSTRFYILFMEARTEIRIKKQKNNSEREKEKEKYIDIE